MSKDGNIIADLPIVEVAVGLNLILDIVERIREKHGVTITPENIGAYIAARRDVRRQLNSELGIAGGA